MIPLVGARGMNRAFLTLVLVALALIVPPPAAGESSGDLPALRRQALDLVNQERRQEGLPALRLDAEANAAAQAHASDMLARNYYSHTSPSGATVRDRYQQAGGSTSHLTAENIARCQGCTPPPIGASVDALHDGWMKSAPHRENILRRGLSEFGFGIAVGAERGLYAVQVFAGPGQPHDLQPGEAAAPIDAEAQLRSAIDAINRMRREAGRAPLAPSAALAAAAQNLLPPPAAEPFTLAGHDLFAALPEDERRAWRSLAVLGAACGGCGVAPTAADIRDFAQRWRNDEGHRTTLLRDDASHLGFAMVTNGEGRKLGVAVIGSRR